MEDQRSRALRTVESCTEPDKLEKIARNARRLGEQEVARAAELKLFALLPSAETGTLEHDVWQSIHALEAALKSERGKTIRLARTRQKIARVGEWQTVHDLVNGRPSDGFDMLIDRDMPRLTFEAVALRHPDRFDEPTLEAAATRLRDAGARI